jgi:hypothetical protein
MKRMESAMHANGISIDDSDLTPIAQLASAQAELEDKLSILVLSDDGNAGFVGPSSGFSLFSPQGLKWIREKTGNRDFETVLQDVNSEACHGQEYPLRLPNAFVDKNVERYPLPPKSEADQYVKAFMEDFNISFPLYHQATFLERYEKDYYTADPDRDPAWYASLNVVLMLGRSIQRREKGQDLMGERIFANACSVFTDLLFNGSSLLAVQAMIGMVCFLAPTYYVDTNNNRPSSFKQAKTPTPHTSWSAPHAASPRLSACTVV